VIVSGAKASEESAFPAEAVKSFHEKPFPTHDKVKSHWNLHRRCLNGFIFQGAATKPKIIHQPKKWILIKAHIKGYRML